ncbi:MAG: hypothetical protein BMS9Abin37_1606 [Acidobacteriota bacterium]|nr:MAG: hypothetical protein BMS9Abin37_1606 [Acidobacteriota bacterium]
MALAQKRFEGEACAKLGYTPKKCINATTHNDLKPALHAGPTLTNVEECQRRLSVSVHARGVESRLSGQVLALEGKTGFAESVNDG